MNRASGLPRLNWKATLIGFVMLLGRLALAPNVLLSQAAHKIGELLFGPMKVPVGPPKPF